MPIVCGTDFSEGAAHAVRVAALFARALRERLVLVHVLDLGALGWASESLAGELARAAAARLAEVAEPLRREGVDVEVRATVGAPDEMLAGAVEETAAQLAVVGMMGRRRAGRWRVGSLAARLARSAPAPVLLVPDAAPFERCASGEAPLRVLVAADGSAAGEAAAAWLPTLRRLGPCAVRLFHVYDPARERARLGLPGRAHEQEVEAVLAREIEERLRPLEGDELRVEPVIGWVAESVALATERERFDLVLIGGRQRGALSRIRQDSVSEGLLRLAPAAVLRIPVAAAARRPAALPVFATVLAPTDLSAIAAEGVRYAYALAAPGGTVVLLHAVEAEAAPNPLYAHYTPGRRATPEERADESRAVEAALRALAPAEAEARGIETRLEIVHGQAPAEAIRAAAERLGADAICMASHGRSGWSRLLAGSVAREVAEIASRPVLLVRPPRED